MEVERWKLSDGLVSRWDTGRERITELEGISTETFQTKVQRENNNNNKKLMKEGRRKKYDW